MLLRASLTAAAGIGAGSAVLAGTADSKFKVSAATATDSKEVSSNSSSSSDVKKQAKHQIRACELPIYEEPAAVEFEIVPVKPSAYYQAISDARKWVWTYTDSIKDTTKQVTDTYDLAKKYSLDGLQYIQKDSGTVPRAIFISVSGLFGIVFAYRGGFIRKTLYATTAMAGAASICYPNEARDISSRGWKAARGIIITAYKDLSGLPANEPLEKTKSPGSAESVKRNQAPQTDKVSTSEQKTVQVKSTSSSSPDVKDSKSNTVESKKDFGMSNPDDKDLYSTRGK